MKNVISSIVALFSFLLVLPPAPVWGRSVLEIMPSAVKNHSHTLGVTLLNEGIAIQIANKKYTILFGTPRQDIERVLGEGTHYAGIHKPFFFLDSRHYRPLGLTLHYHNDQLVFLSLNPNEQKDTITIHLDQWSFRFDQAYNSISDKLHAIADQVLPHQTFRLNHNYLSIHKNNQGTLSVINYGNSFFDPFLQQDKHNFVQIKWQSQGLIIENKELYFGMSQAEVEAILGKADSYIVHFAMPSTTESFQKTPQKNILQHHILIYHAFASRLIFEKNRLVEWNHLVAQSASHPILPILELYDQENMLLLNAMDYYHRPLGQLPIMVHKEGS